MRTRRSTLRRRPQNSLTPMMYATGSPAFRRATIATSRRRCAASTTFSPYAMSAEASSPRALPASTRASSAGVGERPVSSTRPASIAAAMVRSGAVIAGEAAPLLVGEQRVDDRIETAVEDAFQIARREPDAVVGEAVLRKVVRADLLAPVAGADLRAPRARRLLFLFPQLRFIEMGA